MWLQDTANDQFFPVKIVNDLKAGKILVNEGIANSGLNTRYPTYYVYLLGFIRLINNTYEATLVVHIFLSFLLLIIIYKITKLLSSENGGLIALTIATFSRVLIEESAVVYSAYFPLPFAFFSLYILLKELLSKRPNPTLILLSLFILAFMTTFSYALCFQLVLSIILLIIFAKNRLQKFLFSLAAITFFLLFNLQTVLKYPIYEFVKTNFRILLFPDTDIYNPGIYDNLFHQFRAEPGVFFLGVILISILFIYFTKSHSSQNDNKKVVLILFFYWIISSVIISRFGQFYKGIFAYPILYIVLGCFFDKIAKDRGPKNILRLIVSATAIVTFIIIPTLTLPKFRSLSLSHYNLSKEYAQKIVAEENIKTLFLILTERDNKMVHWSSISIWYFDYLIHNQNYELLPNQFCPALIDGECFRAIPDKIRIICSTESPETDIFEIVQKSDCITEAERINLLTGSNTYKVNGSYYDIQVDKTKYKNLRNSIIY